MVTKYISPPAHGLLQELPKPQSSSQVGWPWSIQQNPQRFQFIKHQLDPIIIVIPTYNQGQYIEEAFRSILLQNYPKLILVVIDGGSTDSTQEVLKQYSPWLSYVYSGPDSGQASALNVGFGVARGLEPSDTAFCAWLNSDDLFLPSTFLYLSQNNNNTSKIYYGDSLILHEDTGILSYHLNPRASSRYMKYGGILASHATFWKSSIHVDFDERYQCALDYEYWLRLVPHQRLKRIRHPLGIIRVHDQAKSHSAHWQAAWEADMKLNGAKHSHLYKHRYFLDLEYATVNRFHRYLSKRLTRSNLSKACLEMQRWL